MYPNQLMASSAKAANPATTEEQEADRKRWERIHDRRGALERMWSNIANSQDVELLNRAVDALRPLAIEAIERM